MSAAVTATSTNAPGVPGMSNPATQLTLEQQQLAAQQFGVGVAAPQASASLYVGELDPSVTEAMLFEMFSSVGPVASIRVCRDAVTRRSLGYAYVNFHNTIDGERALETLNYTVIKGKPCRIMWSQRDPALRKTGTGNIFIKNLDKAIDNKALHDTFTAFGNILSCKVAMEDGSSKGYGFVHYETAEAAENAIKHVNGMLLNDKKVYVGHHIPKKERQSKLEEIKAKFTNIYVKNLDTEVTEEEFRNLFKSFGKITSAVIATDEAGNSKGFGFVNYENHDEAAYAVNELHDTELKGKKLFVARAQKKHEREEELRRQYEQAKMEKLNKYQGVNLYIKNLEDDIDDEKLRQEFSVYGVITSAKVMRDERAQSKGFGFVCFSSPDEATKAVTEMNGRMIGNKPIYVALAQRKDVRKSQLEAQINQRNQIRMQQASAGMGAGAYGMPIGYAHPGSYGMRSGRPAPFYGQVNMINAVPGTTPNLRANNFGGIVNRPNGRPQNNPPQNTGRGNPNANRSIRNQYQQTPKQHNQFSQNSRVSNGQGPSNTRNTVPAVQSSSASMSSVFDNRNIIGASHEAQKQLLGEQLFPKISARQPQLAGKITGMLLEMDNFELEHLLKNPGALDAKVEEAVTVLRQHQMATGQDFPQSD
ncbi:1750_t:CDS:2 [Dentiscutata erythropus]|uniref:Polyadenylate-binding protein n=1 Tax=Dentiscutata erythropus TaxID=1348616 RepID=A0A9N9GJ73_9GLOM|nr:1750_t:CDS:2 [Dentiscutata erythropus]